MRNGKSVFVRHVSYFGLWKTGYHLYIETWARGEMRASAILGHHNGDYYRARTLREAIAFAAQHLAGLPVVVDTKKEKSHV